MTDEATGIGREFENEGWYKQMIPVTSSYPLTESVRLGEHYLTPQALPLLNRTMRPMIRHPGPVAILLTNLARPSHTPTPTV